ncbi:DUF4007 family protein [Oxynema aestuarii]|uniref:DUF4007 family protein n=1 Tax=Oxynema aestuarii AP17 TaxID=2064643 RepID=A0A6H1U4R6_9CYAN|nr:DUF4007 family protein [Oxynema aestuarii]QIZ72619.1 DUF4007 family protein [Oxynema aestuarii AP17]
MPKLQLSFTRNFPLKKEDLLKVLRTAAEKGELNKNKERQMEETALGSEKIGPMMKWSMRCGLLHDRRLTPEGEIAIARDPYLQHLTTDWLMHFYLSFGDRGLAKPPEHLADWGGWTYFVYEFLPEHRTFTEGELIHHLSLVFPDDKAPVISKNTRFLLRAYYEFYALSGAKFLTLKDKIYHTDQTVQPNPYAIAYLLAKIWERDYPHDGSILTESLLNNPMGLAPVLGVRRDRLQAYLDRLESLGIIEQRRAVPPAQIVRRWQDPLPLLEKAYELDSSSPA